MNKAILFTILVLSLGGTIEAQTAGVVFLDTFETHDVGSNLDTVAPEQGSHYWIDYGSRNSNSPTLVSDEQAKSGSKSLKSYRQVNPYLYPQIMAYGSTATENKIVPADQGGLNYLFETSFYLPRVPQDGPNIQWSFDSPTGNCGGLSMHGSGKFQVYNGGSNSITDVQAQAGIWYDVAMVATPTAAQGDYMSFTIDVFLTPEGGATLQLADDLAVTGSWNYTAGNSARITLFSGYPSDGESATAYYDDVVIEIISDPVCGDKYHPYPPADLNGDCVVDIKDFAIFSSSWLDCTDINCP